MTMSSCLLLTCLLATIATTGYSLSCIECTSLGDTMCNATPKTCSSEHDSCLLTYIVTSMGGMEISKMYIRQCGQSSLCLKTGSISLPNGRIKTGTTCCKTNDCMPTRPVLPPDSNKKNGFWCKTCFAPNSQSCDTEILTECIGEETMCISQVTNRTGDVATTTSVRGCATKEMCEPARQVWNLTKMTVYLENTCTNSGIAVQPHLFLPIIALWLLFFTLSC
ncbi:u-PAR/Ly-6 domain [Pristimantis euphronides]